MTAARSSPGSETPLLPCPFCGSEEISLYSLREEMYWVSCISCGLEAPTETGVTRSGAIAYWNRRAGVAQGAREGADLTKIAAECHRAKWQFDLNEDYTPSRGVGRGLIISAFNELHRIGDLALKMRDALPLQVRGGK